MIRVFSLSNPRIAQAFVDHMATLGITLTVKHEGQEVQIWLEDDAKLDLVEAELASFIKDPSTHAIRQPVGRAVTRKPNSAMNVTPIGNAYAARLAR